MEMSGWTKGAPWWGAGALTDGTLEVEAIGGTETGLMDESDAVIEIRILADGRVLTIPWAVLLRIASDNAQ